MELINNTRKKDNTNWFCHCRQELTKEERNQLVCNNCLTKDNDYT